MKLKGIGVSLMSYEDVSSLDRLSAKLEAVKESGFDTVELPIQGMNVLLHGEIDRPRLQAYRKLLCDSGLHLTLHAPFDLNLFRESETAFEERLFLASLDITGELGAATMVYHVARFVGEEQLIYPQSWKQWDDSAKHRALEEEASFIRRAGDRARMLGVQIGMENMRPYLDCGHYCYAVMPKSLAMQVTAIQHPNVGVALDVGHLHLAVEAYGLNMKEELAAVLPYVNHLHVHDNYGKPCYSIEKNQYEMVPLGRGDMHLPIGMGTVPMGEIAQALRSSPFNGYLIHEVRQRYESDWPALSRLNWEHAAMGEVI